MVGFGITSLSFSVRFVLFRVRFFFRAGFGFGSLVYKRLTFFCCEIVASTILFNRLNKAIAVSTSSLRVISLGFVAPAPITPAAQSAWWNFLGKPFFIRLEMSSSMFFPLSPRWIIRFRRHILSSAEEALGDEVTTPLASRYPSFMSRGMSCVGHGANDRSGYMILSFSHTLYLLHFEQRLK